jgi:thiamine biosynthesis lipoprotein
MPNFTIEFKAMGCHIQAWLSAQDIEGAAILQRLPDWFEDWEAKFSRFRPTSELCNLNRHAGQWVRVSQSLFEVIGVAMRGAEETNGLFNPLILPALEAAGYDHSFDPDQFIPGHRDTEATVPTFRSIELNPDKRSVRLPAHAQIDLGGIAKGWSAQQAADRLWAVGACLVDAGGDMVATGSPDELGGWLVSIPDPITGEDACTVLLTDSAIATSGRDHRQWLRDGQPLHHIIDPRTGRPSTGDVLAASVIAPDAIHAEIWAKAAMIDQVTTRFPTMLFLQDGSMVHNREFATLCKNEAR